MQIPIGYDDFGKVREKQLDYVDKSLFIKEVIDEKATEVIVITRPRRFGKTLNLSMLHHFFVAETYGRKTQGLFDGLNIAALGEPYMQHQGKYPVIFITLKDIRDHSFQHTLEKLSLLLASLYSEHTYLLQSPQLDEADKQFFSIVLKRTKDQAILEIALHHLSHFLFKHYGTKVWLLIDEYDTPIHSAFLHGYYQEMIGLMRALFGAVFKTNPYLEKAIITGILRIAKESLFSGLNNVKTYSVLDKKYGEYFGFTETETNELLIQANLEQQADEIRHWYNGYSIGGSVIYNPWSIANCLNDGGILRPYWVNTSGNDLVRHLLARGDESLKDNLALLLNNQPIEAFIEESTVFGDLEKDNSALWSLLLFSGYLKAIEITPYDTGFRVKLLPPNYEVYILYRGIIRGWFEHVLGYTRYESFLKSLIHGEVKEFTRHLQNCLQETFSLFDITGHHPEKFYHGFILGLMVSLKDTHEVHSNKESGYGRYDVMLIPKDPSQLGIVLEFKTISNATNLTQAAEQALQQIREQNYVQTLRNKGIAHILQLGLAFHHKTVAVAHSYDS